MALQNALGLDPVENVTTVDKGRPIVITSNHLLKQLTKDEADSVHLD